MTSTTTSSSSSSSSSSSVLLESEPIPLQMSGVVTMGHGGLEQLVWRTDLPVPSLQKPLECFADSQQCALAQVPLVLVKVLAAGACVHETKNQFSSECELLLIRLLKEYYFSHLELPFCYLLCFYWT